MCSLTWRLVHMSGEVCTVHVRILRTCSLCVCQCHLLYHSHKNISLAASSGGDHLHHVAMSLHLWCHLLPLFYIASHSIMVLRFTEFSGTGLKVDDNPADVLTAMLWSIQCKEDWSITVKMSAGFSSAFNLIPENCLSYWASQLASWEALTPLTSLSISLLITTLCDWYKVENVSSIDSNFCIAGSLWALLKSA